jgi:hypothetical protein
MGCDGGSIPTRRELVRTASNSQSSLPNTNFDAQMRNTESWFICALSREPLRQPIVSCPKGRLYNKEAILMYLIQKKQSPEETINSYRVNVAGHVNSLKDLTTLRLVSNPTNSNSFICPVTRREMNGQYRFAYLKPCGCVLSSQALPSATNVCLICETPFKEIIWINEPS